jgi:phosphate transport system protein
MTEQHIVKAYDNELTALNSVIARMGGLAEAQLESAIEAMRNRDSSLAARTIEADAKVDALENDVDNRVVKMLALRQPMARDLREIVAALKISSDLERIADYATNVAKRTISLAQAPTVRPAHVIPRMGALALAMLRDVLDAYDTQDSPKAIAVWNRDEELDEMYNSLFRELLTYMMEDARSITSCTHILFMAKNIERIGDHATNIAETIYFMIHGEPLLAMRPKGTRDDTVVNPLVEEDAKDA